MPTLDQDPLSISKMIPYDFTKTMGQYALEIVYTNGDTQMLTTPMNPGRGSDKGDFNSYEELVEFYNKYR